METSNRKHNKTLRENEHLPGKSMVVLSSLVIEECTKSIIAFDLFFFVLGTCFITCFAAVQNALDRLLRHV
jgi:hypothetical protein